MEEAGEDEKESPAKSKFILKTEVDANRVMDSLKVGKDGLPTQETPPFEVLSINAKDRSRRPPNPYTTSTVQQDASTRLKLAPKRTMLLAQQLYEGIDLGEEGPVGLITYMRTDSIRISEEAKIAARNFIEKTYGKDYVGDGTARATKTGNPDLVQDAHEAIGPPMLKEPPKKQLPTWMPTSKNSMN